VHLPLRDCTKRLCERVSSAILPAAPAETPPYRHRRHRHGRAQVGAAVKRMRALMPGTQWEARLGAGGTAFMSFCSMLGSSGLTGSSGQSGGGGG
jgi:hypothetical protein